MDKTAYKLLYTQDQLPIFQNRMYDTELEAKNCLKGNVRLVEDLQSGLVLNQSFCPELMIYDSNYQNEQGISPHFKMHLESVAEIVERGLGKSELVEVGCGKGFFLEKLLARGFDITGFDPAYEGSNERIQPRYFEPGVGMKAQGLILRHVLEHIQHPYAFLCELCRANANQGLIYIEVPCFDWICEHRAWFDIFYEHVNYFRLADFDRMFGDVIDKGRFFGGQYLYVVANLASLKPPQIDPQDRVQFPDGFGVARLSSSDKGKVAIWGGASKGVIFATLQARLGSPVDFVIDINPAKQGKYLPITGLRVHSPEEIFEQLPPGSTVYVMNSNYLEEIKTMSQKTYRYVGVDHG